MTQKSALQNKVTLAEESDNIHIYNIQTTSVTLRLRSPCARQIESAPGLLPKSLEDPQQETNPALHALVPTASHGKPCNC